MEEIVKQTVHEGLADFVRDWNQKHDSFKISPLMDEEMGRPLFIFIRYTAVKHRGFYSLETWTTLCDIISAKSRGLCTVKSDSDSFERGAISLEVMSMSHNYQERLITGALRWLTGEFFPQ